jgi:hypothetical protein
MPSRLLYGVALSAACALVSGRASAAPDVPACVAAFEEAQALNNAGKYLEAAERGRVCTDASCGEVVTPVCTKLYEAIMNATPTLVPAARDADQNDLADVRLFVDGKLVREKLDGSPLSLDPGTHVFRFEARGLPAVERSQIVRPGEKLRVVSVTLVDPRKPPPPAPASSHGPVEPAPTAPKPPSVFVSRSAAAATGVLAGVGALALAGFGLLRWSGMTDFNNLVTTCKPDCTANSVDSVREKLIISDVALGVGVAAAGTALGLLGARFAAGSSTEIRVVPQSTGGAAQLAIRF